MTALLELTVYFTIWTLISVVLGAAIRNQEWTKEGRDIVFITPVGFQGRGRVAIPCSRSSGFFAAISHQNV